MPICLTISIAVKHHRIEIVFLVSDGGLDIPVAVMNELCARVLYVSATSTAGSRAPRLEEIIES